MAAIVNDITIIALPVAARNRESMMEVSNLEATGSDVRPPSDLCFRQLDTIIIRLDEQPKAPRRWALRTKKAMIERHVPGYVPGKAVR